MCELRSRTRVQMMSIVEAGMFEWRLIEEQAGEAVCVSEILLGVLD